MKKLLLAVLILAAACSTAQAKSAVCDHWRDVTVLIMEARQKGISVTDAMDIADKVKDFSSTDRDIWKAIVYEAYSQHPVYQTDKFRRKVINEFADDVYLKCYKEVEMKD